MTANAASASTDSPKTRKTRMEGDLKETSMRLKLALLTTALAFGLGTTAALAEDAPGAKSDITIVENNPSANNVPGTSSEGKGDSLNSGALSAPQQGDQGNAPAAVAR